MNVGYCLPGVSFAEGPYTVDHIAWNDESCASYFPWLCGFTSWQAAGHYAISSCCFNEIGVPFTDTTMVEFWGTSIRDHVCLATLQV